MTHEDLIRMFWEEVAKVSLPGHTVDTKAELDAAWCSAIHRFFNQPGVVR